MFAILNAAFTIATRLESWSNREKRPTLRPAPPQRDWFHDQAHDPRSGLRPGESWTDRP